MVRGRISVDNNGIFLKNSSDEFKSRSTTSAKIAAKWIESDYSVAKKCGFVAIDRK
jgi:hypothetical protein